MLHRLIKSGDFIAEREKVNRLRSRLLMSAVDVIEAACWLIAGNQYAQGLVLLDSAIELVLKGELERIHRILIADTKKLDDFKTLKSLLKDAFLQHPSGKDLNIPDFDIERTIYFETAFDRVAELYPTIGKWRKQLLPRKAEKADKADDNALHALRNEIVHYGGDPAATGRYVAAIIEVALPFLEELFFLITQHEQEPVRMSHLLMEWVYREVGVAATVLKDLRVNGFPPAAYAIAPLAHHIVWTNTQWPNPNDDLYSITTYGFNDWEESARRQKLPNGWEDTLVIEVDCPICGSRPGDGSIVLAKVLIEREPIDEKLLVPEGFLCHVCGLYIDPSQRYLAKHFVQIPPEIAADYLKDIGID